MENITFEVKEFEFLDEKDGEAFASISLNPTFRWCKFILTDAIPNLNKKRIPLEEFDNLIRTGVNSPIKMTPGEIGDHAGSTPLGTIAALKKENDKVYGLAALWSEERPEDVEMIKKAYDDKQPLNLSWEVLYSDKVEEDDGVTALKNTALRAVTFVRLPAYAGRTPALEVSSVEGDSQENKSGLEETELEELEQAKQRIAELEALLAEKDTALSAKDTELSSKDAELASLKEEKEALASFKSQVEAEKAEAEKLASIRAKFTEAGLDATDEFMTEKKDILLSLSDSALDFMVQEMVSFASKIGKTEEKSSVEVPNLSGNKNRSPRELGQQLRTSK